MAASYKKRALQGEYAVQMPAEGDRFRGALLSCDPARLDAAHVCEVQNMYRDYAAPHSGALEMVPGFRRVAEFREGTAGARIHAIHRFEDATRGCCLAVHAGERLFVAPEEEVAEGRAEWITVTGSLAPRRSSAFAFGGTLYLLDGVRYQRLVACGAGFALRRVAEEAYAPRLALGGEEEALNLLSPRCQWQADAARGEAPSRTPTTDFSGAEALGGYGGSYVGTDSFVMPQYGNTDALAGDTVRLAVYDAPFYVDADPNVSVGAVLSARDASVTCGVRAVALMPSACDLTVRPGAFGGYNALESLYILPAEGHRVSLEGEIAMSGGSIYLGASKNALAALFSDVAQALANLPANVVLRAGEECDTGVALTLAEMPEDQNALLGGHTSNTSFRVNATRRAPGGGISLFTRDGRLMLEADAALAPGRYYLWGDLRSSRGYYEKQVLRIDVLAADTAAEDMPTPVHDVFDAAFTPRAFPLGVQATAVERVRADGAVCEFGTLVSGGTCRALCVMLPEGAQSVTVDLTLQPQAQREAAEALYRENQGFTGTPEQAIEGCTLCALLDGRVFLSGNPALPHTVFCSAVGDPTYLAADAFFCDGVGFDAVTALLPLGDTLFVCKRDGVYAHSEEGGRYPLVCGSFGRGTRGACCVFDEQGLLLCRDGVFGIERTVGDRFTLRPRSVGVDAALLQEIATAESDAALLEWEGYLCLFLGGSVYLADSRSTYRDAAGNVQNEWFVLRDVGIFTDGDGVRQPLYASVTGALAVDGEPLAGELVQHGEELLPLRETERTLHFGAGEVFSATVREQTLHFAPHGDGAVVVAPTGEYEKSGVFHAALCPITVGQRLYFCTDTGAIFLFNNDRRGKPYGAQTVPACEIHPRYYSFDGHRIEAGFATRAEDCGLPHFCKSTLPRSAVVHCMLPQGSGFLVAVRTARGQSDFERIGAAGFDFGTPDMESFSFYSASAAHVIIKEKEKQWTHKQYLFRDSGFCRPFGIFGVAYRCRIAGRSRE